MKLLFALVVFLFSSTLASASTVSGSVLESNGYRQGWLVRNDYTTAMNPPNCKLRNPTQEELDQIIQKECVGYGSECSDHVYRWPNLWETCSSLGMSTRIVDGERVAFFPSPEPTTTSQASAASSISPTASVETTQSNAHPLQTSVKPWQSVLSGLGWLFNSTLKLGLWLASVGLFAEFVILPNRRYSTLERKIVSAHTKYGNIRIQHIGGAGRSSELMQEENRREVNEANDKLRELSGDFRALKRERFYKLLSQFNLLPKPGRIKDVSENLIGAANSLWDTDGHKDRRHFFSELARLMDIKES